MEILLHQQYIYLSSDNRTLQDLQKIKDLLKNENPITWLFIGDSIAQGAKHTYGLRSFSEIFSERIRWELTRYRDIVINTSISGATSQNLLDDFQWRVSQFNSNVVFIMIGTNDAAYPNIQSIDFSENLIRLVDEIRDQNSIPVIQTPNTIIMEIASERSRLTEFVQIMRRVADQKGVLLIDNWKDWSIDNLNEKDIQDLLDDAIHPNGNGHKKIAKLLFQEIGIYDAESNLCKY